MELVVFLVGAAVMAIPVAVIAVLLLNRPSRILKALLVLLGLGPLLLQVFTPRSTLGIGVEPEMPASSVWLSRGLILAWASLVLIGFLSHIRSKKSVSRPGLALGVTGLTFSMGPLLAGIFGLDPIIDLRLVYLPMTLLGLLALQPNSLSEYVSTVKTCLGTYTFTSVLAIAFFPEWATTPYSGFLPGVEFRLNGVVSHANTLGPLAALYLILPDTTQPGINRKWTSVLSKVVAVLVLVLSQSKTAWIITLGAYVLRSRRIQRLSGLNLAIVTLGATAVGLFAALAIPNIMISEPDRYLLLTLTGRTNVWTDTLDLWRENPWFGYGPNIWSMEHRLSVGGLAYAWVGQAHNQFIQTLGETGTIGFVLLLGYVICMTAYGLRYSIWTSGVSSGLVLAVLTRTATETPLRNYSLNEGFFMHVIVVGYLIYAAREKEGHPGGQSITQQDDKGWSLLASASN